MFFFLRNIFKETKFDNNGTLETFDRAPAGLKLFMDGVEKAGITEGSDTELVDMMDWNTGSDNIPLASSFKIIWDLNDNLARPVGLRRVTIGYANEGLTTLTISLPLLEWTAPSGRLLIGSELNTFFRLPQETSPA